MFLSSTTRRVRALRRPAFLLATCAAFLSGCSESTAPKSYDLGGASRDASVAAPASLGVLIYGPSVFNGTSSLEAQTATALGYPVTVVTQAQWSAMTAADFSQYRAIVLGDPRCSAGFLGTPTANAQTWGPVVNGNVFIIGSDPSFHASVGNAGAREVINSGIKFAADAPGQTGAYITLSCDGRSGSVLDGLSPLGHFVMSTSAPPCGSSVDKVADAPALAALTASSLSGWGCSIHETFTSWPSDFDVYATALDGTGTYVAPDGRTGTPYLLVRGKGLVIVSDIKLAPPSGIATINSPMMFTATVLANDAPVASTPVTFTIVDGPNTGKTQTATTDANGVASFTYTSAVEGTDGIRATFVDALHRTQTSNRSAIEWTKPTDATPPAVTHTTSGATANASGWYSSDVTVTFTATDAESPVTTTGCDAQTVSATTSVDGVTFTCVAKSDGGSTTDAVTIKLDKTKPTVTGAITSGTLGANGWYTDNVGITWTPSAAGPSGQSLSSDCSNVSLTADAASHTFTCTVTTGAGISSAQGTVTVKRDAQSPHISYALTGPSYNGWFTGSLGVNWTVTAGPSGVNSCTSAPVTTDGTSITFSCSATAGNGKQASLTTAAAKHDGTPPVVTYTGNLSNYTVDQNIAIVCTPTDNLSGVAASNCAPISGAAYTFTIGSNSYSATAQDNAGNTGGARTSFTVSVTQGSLCTLASRWVSNAGVANSLCVKLQHGDYGAFTNELSAQSGKKISADNAATLLRLVNLLDK